MTTTRKKKDEPAATERPKLKKETIRDLDPKRLGEEVRGGKGDNTRYCDGGGSGNINS